MDSAQGMSTGNNKGSLGEIHFSMLFPKQLLKLQFNLTLYDYYKNIFQRKLLETPESHTEPLKQYIPYHFKGSNFSQSFETPTHTSFLFGTQRISWSFTKHASAQSCLNNSFCSSYRFLLILCLV
ncbi:LOW QUALITY PROTEIN: galectin-3-binding protein [Hemicordylus capensis]|uniref:LOW QUALITY PROTEIN: galectin-3-binding protein n=1 Tax=Hemicordylus capensis TaxID=884348 RepID=UPI0023020A28|nr:LOW QUALITY PROTEIN: galectin-3-binding protein [Hemicordylus capensis]